MPVLTDTASQSCWMWRGRRSTVPDLADLRSRGLVIDELTKTERQYARSLTCLQRVFLARVEPDVVFPDQRGKEAFFAFREVPLLSDDGLLDNCWVHRVWRRLRGKWLSPTRSTPMTWRTL